MAEVDEDVVGVDVDGSAHEEQQHTKEEAEVVRPANVPQSIRTVE